MEAYTEIEVTEDFALATWHNMLICVLCPGNPDAFLLGREPQDRLREKYGDNLVSLTILQGNLTPLFSARSRQIAREQLNRTRGATKRMALAVLSEGLFASATRTTMNALSALLKLDFEWRTFEAIAPACMWLAPAVIPPADPTELTKIVEHTYALPQKVAERRVR